MPLRTKQVLYQGTSGITPKDMFPAAMGFFVWEIFFSLKKLCRNKENMKDNFLGGPNNKLNNFIKLSL